VKLLITLPWGERLGGAEAMLWSFLRRIDRTRVEPTVIFFEDGGFPHDVSSLGIRTAVLETGRLREGRRLGRSVRTLAGTMRREQPDVVLNWVAKAQIYGGAAAALAGMSERVVWWQHGVTVGHWMDRVATALPAHAVGCSSSTAARAQAALWPRRPAFVVHPGVEPSMNGASPPAPQLDIPTGRTVIGIVGRLQPWKGQHRLLHALARLRERRLDVHGLIVGGDAYGLSPEYAAGLRRLVGELGLEDRVTLTGQVPDVGPYVRAMDVLVSASDREPFGIVLLEGMAEARPVVAVGDAGPLDIVDDGRTGVLVSSPAPGLLADALEPLVRDPERRRELGDRGQDRFLEHFTAEAMTAALVRRLEDVAR
jgi:glycosyltransferase involved in cell wall biosynthesis